MKKDKISNWPWGKIFIILFILSLLFGGFLNFLSTRVYADTTGWVDNAGLSQDSDKIATDLKKARAGLSKWDATSGNAFLFLGTPSSDMSEVVLNLDSHITKAEGLSKLDKTSKEYTDGIKDLNESLSYNLDLFADVYWLRHQALPLYLISLLLNTLTAISFIVFFIKRFIVRPKK